MNSILWLLLFLLPLGLHATPPSHDSPKLFIGGGGATGGLRQEYFTKLAGPDARLMVIPSPGGSPDLEAIREKWRERGFTKVAVLHTADEAEAKTDRFAEPLKFATAVWIDGGKMQVVGKSYVIRIRMVEGKLQIDAFKEGDVLPLPANES